MSKKNRTFSIAPLGKTDTVQFSIPETESKPITQQPISFRIECCNANHCFKKIVDFREKADFADKLHELSQLTWGQINQASRKNFGYETLDELKPKCKKTPPGATIIGFVYHDNHRMVGHRDYQGVFHILLFDYDGKLYSH